MSIWKDSQNVLHDDMDGAALSLPSWPQGMTKLTDEEVAALRVPPSLSGNALICSEIEAVKAQFTDTLQMKAMTGNSEAQQTVAMLLSQIDSLKAQLV